MVFQGPQKVKYGKVGLPDTVITAKDIIIATGSTPLVPKGIEVDGKCLFLHPYARVKTFQLSCNRLSQLKNRPICCIYNG